MDINKQLLLVSLLLVYSFLSIRGFLWGVKELYLNKNERKKRKQGQTFKEWFFYTRYRDRISKPLIWLYFTVLIIHPPFLVSVCIAYFIVPIQRVTSVLSIALIIFDAIWLITILFLSWKPGSPWLHFEQWVPKPKKRKNKKKTKK